MEKSASGPQLTALVRCEVLAQLGDHTAWIKCKDVMKDHNFNQECEKKKVQFTQHHNSWKEKKK